MGELAEKMIAEETHKEGEIKQDKIELQSEKTQEKKQETNKLILRYFSGKNIDTEWFWEFIAYTYFICRTLGLLILISVIIFGISNTVRFIFIYIAVAILNLIFYKYVLKKKIRDNI